MYIQFEGTRRAKNKVKVAAQALSRGGGGGEKFSTREKFKEMTEGEREREWKVFEVCTESEILRWRKERKMGQLFIVVGILL